MQTIQSVLIGYISIRTFLDEHLAYLDVSVEGCVVNCCKLLVKGLLVDPYLDHFLLLILRVLTHLILCNLKQLAENDSLVLDRSLVE